MRLYGYLRASTKEQDASRAKKALEQFGLIGFHKKSCACTYYIAYRYS